MVKDISQEINPARINGKDLVIAFDFQFQIVAQVCTYFMQQRMQYIFIRCKNHNIIGITPKYFTPLVSFNQWSKYAMNRFAKYWER